MPGPTTFFSPPARGASSRSSTTRPPACARTTSAACRPPAVRRCSRTSPASRPTCSRSARAEPLSLMKTSSAFVSRRPFLALAAAALGLAAGCSRTSGAARANAAPVVPVQVAVAVQQDVPRRVESIGTVQAVRSVSVKSQVDGGIAQVNFQEGQEVKAGDLLVTLDRRPFQNALAQARAAAANAKAQASLANADAERYAHLDQQSAISKESYAQYLTKAEMAKADVQAKEAAVAWTSAFAISALVRYCEG